MATDKVTVYEVRDALPTLHEAVRGAPSLMEFYDAEVLGNAHADAHWTAAEEIRILTGIAGDSSEEPAARMKAMEMLARRRLDALRFSAHLAKITAHQSQESDGPARQSVTAEVVRIAHDARLKTLDLLKLGGSTKSILPHDSQSLAPSPNGVPSASLCEIPLEIPSVNRPDNQSDNPPTAPGDASASE